MYEYAKYEMSNWLKGIDSSTLNSYDRTLLGILIDHFDEIAQQGTAKGGRANLISRFIIELGRNTRLEIPDITNDNSSHPSIEKLLVLYVEKFRGFCSPVEFKFNDKYTLFHGSNGSGKTSMCEALEYSILGTIEEASSRTIPLKRYIIHAGEKKAKEPKLKCRFSDGSEEYCSPDLDTYRFAFIEKNRIDSFSHMGATTAKNQTDRIAALFGLTEFQNYVSGFTESLDERYIALSTKLDKELEKKKHAVDSKKEQIKKDEEQLIQLNKEIKPLIASIGKDTIKTAESALDYIMNPETGVYSVMLKQAKENEIPEINEDDVSKLKRAVSSFLSETKLLNGDISKLLEDAVSLDLHNFYKSLGRLKDSWQKDLCPACYTPLDKTTLNPFVLAEEQCSKLEEIEKTKQRIKNRAINAASLCSQIKEIVGKEEIRMLFPDMFFSEFLTLNSSADIFEVAREEASICSGIIKGIYNAAVEQGGVDLRVVEYNKHAKEKNKEYDAALRRFQKLHENIARLSAAIEQHEKAIETATDELSLLEKELNQIEDNHEEEILDVQFNSKMVDSYNKLVKSIKDYSTELPARIASDLSSKVADYYNVINDGDADFELIEELSLPTNSGERIRVKMKDGETQDAMQLLSEGHVRILGLSILLAKATKSGVPFLIFDDVVNAIDDDHRDGVAQLLIEHPDFSSTQMILTCHGELFVSKLEERVRDRKTVDRYRFLPADTLNERGVVIKYDDAKTPLIMARSKFENDELKDCAAKCRQAVESILPKLWNKVIKHSNGGISVELRKIQSTPDVSQIATALQKATKPGKSLSGTEEVYACLQRLTAQSTWNLLNKGTHVDQRIPEFTRKEVKELLTIVEELADEVNKLKLVVKNTANQT